jgi:extracellular elastinolytic metalloproteinase
LLLGLALAQMYVPPANVEYFEHGHVIRDNATPNPLEILSEKYQIPLNQIKIQKEYTDSDNIKHVYGIRILNGIPVMNQNFAIHFKDGKVLAISSSYRPTAKLVKRQTESIDLSRAVEIAEKQFGIKRDDFPAQKVYLQTSPEQLTLVHQFQLRDDDQNKWFQVSVDTVSGKVVESIDYVHHATFDAIDFRKPDVLSGFEEFVNPEFTTSSPFGWNSDGTETFNETRGNNVDSIVYGQAKAEQRATGDNLKFDSQFDSTQEIDTEANLRAATINSFYRIFY